MNISASDLTREVQCFGKGRIRAVHRDLSRAGHHPHVDVPLILAVGSRETNLTNEVGDGGHGRGVLQIDDRYNAAVLHHARGCRNGSFVPIFASALPAGRVPTLRDQVIYMVATFESAILYAERQGVPFGHRLKFACSAWNGGFAGALSGFRATEDSDTYTTGKDYGADVLERRSFIIHHVKV